MLMPIDVFKKYKGKTVTVPWSGGLDSTGLLIGMANAGAKVIALTITSDNLPNMEHEECARTKIRNILKDTKVFEQITFQTFHMPPIAGNTSWPNSYYYSQKQMWMSLLPLLVSPESDYVAIGAVSDDNISPIPNLVKQWKSNDWNVKNPNHPELMFPLQSTMKIDLWKFINDICAEVGMVNLPRHISYCEQSTKLGDLILSCGKCPSCLAMTACGLGHVQPMANSKNNKDGLKSIVDIVKTSKTAKLFKLLEVDGVYSYYFSVEADFGDGTGNFYRHDAPVKISRDTHAVVYLGTSQVNLNYFDDFTFVDGLPADHIMVNAKEHGVRLLTFLASEGYSDIDVTEHLENAIKTKVKK